MSKTSIEWTDHSINPIRLRSPNGKSGHYCEKISQGCKNCYSSRFQPRVGLPQFQEQRGKTESLFLDASKLEEVLRRKKPTKWFWCDMTDLFGDWVPFEWITACFGVMAATPWHTHQVLTKRPKRALEFFEWIQSQPEGVGPVMQVSVGPHWPDDGPDEFGGRWMRLLEELGELYDDEEGVNIGDGDNTWPLKNVWLGVSAEDQKTADERIPLLLQCPAVVRLVSAEPLLGPVELDSLPSASGVGRHLDALSNAGVDPGALVPGKLDWVIAGGESGPGARPCNVEWIRSIVRQCKEAGVGCFVKQLGAKSYDWDRVEPTGRFRTNPETGKRQAEFIGAKLKHKKGADPSEWPEDLRIREFPEVTQ